MGFENTTKVEATCPEEIRVGVFFDGTGNNRYNDIKDPSQLKARKQNVSLDRSEYEKRQSASNSPLAAFNDAKECDKKEAEKEDKRSNVAKLFALYKNDSDTYYGRVRQSFSIYKEGIGTSAGRDDDMKAQAVGNEGAKRINEAIKELEAILRPYPATQYNRWIDVFGFSRGSSQARDFINTFNKSNRYSIYNFGFVGIYDTVASFGVGGTNTNFKPKDPTKHKEEDYFKAKAGDWAFLGPAALFKKTPVVNHYFEEYNLNLARDSAQIIIHMAAHDEVRFGFPLTNIADITGRHKEWRFIGVHSDIGGGYASDFGDAKHDLQKHIATKTFDAERDVSAMKNYIKSEEAKGHYIRKTHKPKGKFYEAHQKVEVFETRIVKPDLSKVCFWLMHKYAKLEKLPFDDIPNNSESHIPKDLQGYFDFVMGKPIEKDKPEVIGRPQDAASFSSGNNEEEQNVRQQIYQNYVHRSHSKSAVIDGKINRVAMIPKRRWYVFGKYERNEFANVSKNAVVHYNS